MMAARQAQGRRWPDFQQAAALGIILLGFKLNLAVLFTQGIKCLPIAAVVVR